MTLIYLYIYNYEIINVVVRLWAEHKSRVIKLKTDPIQDYVIPQDYVITYWQMSGLIST